MGSTPSGGTFHGSKDDVARAALATLMAALLALTAAPWSAPRPTPAPVPAPAEATPPPASEWPVEPPAAHNMDAEVLEGARTYAFAPERNTQGVVVVRHGKIVSEWYADGADQSSWATSWSVSKSFTSAMIGIAIDEGLIPGVDEPMTTWFPEWVGTPGGHGPARRADHDLGLEWEESYSPQSPGYLRHHPDGGRAADQLAYAASQPQEAPPGHPVQLLEWRLDAAVRGAGAGHRHAGGRVREGEDLRAHRHGPGRALDRRCRSRSDLLLRRHDLTGFARFGQLFLQEGRWGDEQVVSSEWVAQSTAPSSTFAGYGFQWWLSSVEGTDLYAARGHDGQYIYVVPSLDLVVVRNGSYGKDDGPAVADPNLVTHMPPQGLVPGRGTIGPSSWNDGDFLGPILASIDDTTPPDVEWFDGTTDAFYEVPDPLPPGAPGDLIRVQAVSANATLDDRADHVPLAQRARPRPGRHRDVDLPQRRTAGGRVAGRVARQRHGRTRWSLRTQPKGSTGRHSRSGRGRRRDRLHRHGPGRRAPPVPRAPARATA